MFLKQHLITYCGMKEYCDYNEHILSIVNSWLNRYNINYFTRMPVSAEVKALMAFQNLVRCASMSGTYRRSLISKWRHACFNRLMIDDHKSCRNNKIGIGGPLMMYAPMTNQETISKKEWFLILVFNACLAWIIGIGSGFFFLDNVENFLHSKAVWSNPEMLLPSHGRFFPGIMIMGGIYGRLSAFHIQSLFVGQFLFFAFAAIVFFRFMGKLNVSFFWRWMVMIFLYIQSPFGENLFTIGKQETLLGSLFLLLVPVTYNLLVRNSLASSIIFFILYECLIIWTVLTKETNVSIIVFLLALLFLVWTVLRDRILLKKVFLCILLFACTQALFLLIKRVFDTYSDTRYIDYSITPEGIFTNLDFYYRFHFDLIGIGTLCLAFVLYFGIKKHFDLQTIMATALTLWGWGYLGGMLIWRWPAGYYLLPIYTLFLMAFAFFVSTNIPVFTKYPGKHILAGMFALSAFFAVQYTYYSATTHIAATQVYANSLESVTNSLPDGSRLFMENWNYYHEPVQKTNVFLHDVAHKDIQVTGLGPIFFEAEVSAQDLTLHGAEHRKIEPPQRGDYILNFNNVRTQLIPLRALSPRLEYATSSRLAAMGYKLELLAADSSNHGYLNFGYGKYGFSKTIYSFSLFRVIEAGALDAVETIFADNYTPKEVKLVNLKREQVKIKILPGSFIKHQTNELALYKNDVLVAAIPINTDLAEVDLADYLTVDASTPTDIRFVVKDTFVPSSVWSSSQDHRELGLQVELSFY